MQQMPAALAFRGGHWGALVPLWIFLAGVTWLGLSGKPAERGMWPILIIALGCGVALCRDRTSYAETVIKGMGQPILAVLIMAWMLAGILAELLEAGGLVEILRWASDQAGLTGPGYCVAAFLVACALSTATGTSLGTLAVCAPSLYAAGFPVGAEPALLIGAILGGATFGDNISPVSDTTIASTLTQGARMGDVVRSRLRYAIPAALVAMIAIFVLHGPVVLDVSGPGSGAGGDAPSPRGLPILIAPLLVVVLLLRQAHLLAGLLAGIASAIVVGFVFDLFPLTDLIALDAGSNPYEAGGLLLEGMDRGVPISIFTLLLMGLVAGLEGSGVIPALLNFAEKRIQSAQAAESWSFAVVSIITMLTTHSVIALLAVGRFVRDTGFRHGLAPERRANILDTTVCTYPFILPYCIPTVFAATLTAQAAEKYGVVAQNAKTIGMHNFHSWALLFVVLMAITTGWGRKIEEKKSKPRGGGPSGGGGSAPWQRDGSRSDLHDLSDIRSLSGVVPRPAGEESAAEPDGYESFEDDDEPTRDPTQAFDLDELEKDNLEAQSRVLLEESRGSDVLSERRPNKDPLP